MSMSVRWSRRDALAAAALLALSLSACDDKKKDDDDDNDDDDDKKKKKKKKKDKDDDKTEKKDTSFMDGASFKTVPQTNVQVPVPPGWKTEQVSLYSVASAPDKKAFVAFTTVSSKGEFAGRIQHVVKTFKVTEYKKAKTVENKIGPDKLPASIHDATCKFDGRPAIMSAVLVNTGTPHLVFVVYALAKDAPEKTRKQALATVLLMRKKR